MAVRVGINGFGRIGRIVFRILAEREAVEVVAINDLTDAKSLAHLLKYDSVHGRFNGTVESGDGALVVNGTKIPVLSERDPGALPWAKTNVDVAIESTGVFRERAKIARHLDAGARKVILTVPAKDEIDATIVLGVNDDMLSADAKIVSNASCTTNCLAPMAKVVNDTVGIENGLMTTVHAYTNDQCVGDGIHTDLRRARSAAVNIIPTSTGAAAAIGKVIPALAGKLDGMALRVPVVDGSIVDLVVTASRDTDANEINAAVKKAAQGALAGILDYCEDPIVSTDVLSQPFSCIFDAALTTVIGKRLVKVVGWYDNEAGYSHRVADLVEKIAAM